MILARRRVIREGGERVEVLGARDDAVEEVARAVGVVQALAAEVGGALQQRDRLRLIGRLLGAAHEERGDLVETTLLLVGALEALGELGIARREIVRLLEAKERRRGVAGAEEVVGFGGAETRLRQRIALEIAAA